MAEPRMSTAGITLNYAVEETAGVRPTSGYQEIIEITEIPETTSTPETYDATPLSSKKYHIYVPGLIDLGGALAHTANFSQMLLDLWNKTLVPAYEAAAEEGKSMWFCIIIPGFTDSLYYTGTPSKIGAPGATVASVLQITLPITPTNEPEWYLAPTTGEVEGASTFSSRQSAKKNTEVDL